MTSSGFHEDIVLLIDHANVGINTSPLSAILRCWASECGPHEARTTALLRLYGGWYDEEVATELRGRAYTEYEKTAPAVVRLPGTVCNTRLELADSLALSGVVTPRITHTLALRGAMPRFGRASGAPECSVKDCGLAQTRKWLRGRRACIQKDCGRDFQEMYCYKEQKQVDTHLVIDTLLYAQRLIGSQTLAVCSSDWDMIPALLAAAAMKEGPKLIWARKVGDRTYADPHLVDNSRFKLVEL